MGHSPTNAASTALAIAVCAVLVGGCSSLQAPRIDPSGNRVFVEGPIGSATDFREMPPPMQAGDRRDVTVCPRETIAPVGSEVVLVAAVRGQDEYLRTNERVEWMLEPGGVGQFVQVDPGTWMNLLVGDFTNARKIDNTFAVNTTSRRRLRLTRGTTSPEDDVLVLRGQAWVTVTSPVEGSSRVTAYAPNVHSWQEHKRTATIHWVDAQWSFPTPAINPAGTSHVFTTVVSRQSGDSPCAGWLVRYEIAGGPPAGFAPDGAQVVEVPTDATGRASVEVLQQRPAAGTNTINIQIIRPAGLDASSERLIIARGSTLKTWSAPDIAVLNVGPAVAAVGAVMSYRIDVTNPGDVAADNVVLTEEVPDGVSYLSSDPPAEQSGGKLQWSLGRLAPGETRSVEVDFRAERQGTLTLSAEANATGGLVAQHSASTSIVLPEVELEIVGPEQATVGEQVTFGIIVTNRGQVPATGLLLKDRFDLGLEHAEATSPIERDLGTDLAPGQSMRIGVEFRVTRAGTLCHTVEIIGPGVRTSREACLKAVPAGRSAPQPAERPVQPPAPQERPTRPELGPQLPVPQPQPPTEPQPPSRPADVSLTATGPRSRAVGEAVDLTIRVTNTGGEPLTNVAVACSLDPSIRATNVTGGFSQRPEDLAYVWTLPTLPMGKTAEFQVLGVCEIETSPARTPVAVTTDQGVERKDEIRFEIGPRQGPAPGGLTMTIHETREPVFRNDETTYVIRVVNNGSAPDRSAVLTVIVPDEMSPIALGTFGPTIPRIEGQTVRFDPVSQIEPGNPLEFRVHVQAKRAGTVELQAQLISQNHRLPVIEVEQTLISERR